MSVPGPGAPTTVLAPVAPRRTAIHVSDVALPVSIALWAIGVSRTNATTLGPFGLPAQLPVIFYAGVALLVLSAVIELTIEHSSRWRMALHATGLVVMLYGTAPLVYPEGRYSWLYKTIGVVQYINVHGQLDRQIDIYQNWPGFFALAAWFGKVAGVGSPLAYAKWAQLVFELAALPLLYLIYDALPLNYRQRWMAIFLYSATNWIGQDYLSPQGLGTVLSLGVVAITMHWFYTGNRAQFVPGQDDGSGAEHGKPRRLRAKPSPDLLGSPGRRIAFLVTILFLYFVLTFTHELSPYIVAVQLGVLAAARPLRPRWLPLAMIAIAVGYLLPRFSYVSSHYGLLGSLGSFFGNVAPPSASSSGSTSSIPASQLLIQHCADLLSVIVWLLALAGAWRRRHSGRIVLALLVLTFSPVLVLFGQAYGNEGVLRVYLFSLPWAAALAAAAVEPGILSRKMVPRLRAVTGGLDFSWVRPALRWLRAPVALWIVLALFFVAFFGDDAFDTFPKTEVSTILSFLQTARPGPVYVAEDNVPAEDTARYDLFPLISIFGTRDGAPVVNQATPDIAKLIAENSTTYTRGRGPAYVLIAPSMVPYNAAYAQAPPDSFKILQTSLARSREWKLIMNQDGTMIYELPPGAGSSSVSKTKTKRRRRRRRRHRDVYLETALGSLKAQMKGPGVVLRSKTPTPWWSRRSGRCCAPTTRSAS